MSAPWTQQTPAVTEVSSRVYAFPNALGTLDPCTFKGSNCTTVGTMAPNTTATDGVTSRPSVIYHYLFPPFCSDRVQQQCYDVKLPECEECSNGGAAAFMVLVALLGAAIVVGNALVLAVVGKRRSRGKVENMDLHRTSLAIADLLTGIQLLVVTSYNFHLTMKSTPHEIGTRYEEVLNTPQAAVGGIFFNLTFIASIYNLAYLAGQRFYAFVRPIDYKLQRKQNINIALCFVWLLSVIFSTAYAWFPEHFNFSYSIGAMIFYPSMPSSEWNTPAIVVLVIFLLFPYVLTTCFIIASAFIVHSHLKRSAKAKTAYAQSAGAGAEDSNKSNEIGFFISTVMMQVGFTASVLPCAVVVILLYISSFNARLYANAFVICLYISMLNSLVNVLVYSIRDSKFRSEVADILRDCCCCCGLGKEAMKKVRTSTSTTEKGFSNSTGISRTGRYTKKSQSTASEMA